ncbi:MAG: hypothetical protein MSG78_01075, partial [Clostridiales bacterium]|nr:hypothetical protein [Clostridiales bacterium]
MAEMDIGTSMQTRKLFDTPPHHICVHLSRFSKGEKGSHPFSFRIRTTNRETVKKSMIEKKSQRISNNVRNKIKHDFK